MTFQKVESFLVHSGKMGSLRGERGGCFLIPSPFSGVLTVIANEANNLVRWDHVSVSRATRTPNWPEMDYIKSLFWNDEETVVQFHPPRSQWVNNHPFCLHLWRPADFEIQLPPKEAV